MSTRERASQDITDAGHCAGSRLVLLPNIAKLWMPQQDPGIARSASHAKVFFQAISELDVDTAVTILPASA
jgi:hypothetical protein